MPADVRLWHLADMSVDAEQVRFQGQSGHVLIRSAMSANEADVRALACLLGFTARGLSCALLPLCFALAAGPLRRLSAPLPMS